MRPRTSLGRSRSCSSSRRSNSSGFSVRQGDVGRPVLFTDHDSRAASAVQTGRLPVRSFAGRLAGGLRDHNGLRPRRATDDGGTEPRRRCRLGGRPPVGRLSTTSDYRGVGGRCPPRAWLGRTHWAARGGRVRAALWPGGGLRRQGRAIGVGRLRGRLGRGPGA